MAQKNNKKNKSAFLSYLKSNWLILLICFISAVILWGLIMKDENPERTKTISDVQLVFEGEADLLSRHLVVVGDRDVVLPRMTVKVTIDLLKYADLSEADITASVDLRKINSEGTHTLSVTATSTNGTVLSVYPKTVTIEIDRFSSKKVPVEITTVNELASGFEAGEIKSSKEVIEIEGANSIISNIVKARYEIDLSDVEESINESVLLTLIDDDDNPVSTNEIYGEVPSVNITMPLYNSRELGFDTESVLVNKDLINPNYEIVNVYTVPEKLKLLSDDASVFNGYKDIKLNTIIDISGAKKNIVQKVAFSLPEGVWLDEDMNSVEIHIIINEKQVEKVFEDVKVVIVGESDKYTYKYENLTTDVTIRCGITLANKIDRDDITLYANVTGIENTGEDCIVSITYEFSKGIDATEVYVTLKDENIKFRIEEK